MHKLHPTEAQPQVFLASQLLHLLVVAYLASQLLHLLVVACLASQLLHLLVVVFLASQLLHLLVEIFLVSQLLHLVGLLVGLETQPQLLREVVSLSLLVQGTQSRKEELGTCHFK